MIEFLGNLFSNALAVTVLVILVTSLIGFYVKMRGRDRCLRDLDGFQVTIETKDDHVAWGTLRTYATGVELLYSHADPNETPPPLHPPPPRGRPTDHGGEQETTLSHGGEDETALSHGGEEETAVPAGTNSSSPSPVGFTGEGWGGGQGTDVYTKHSYILYSNELPRLECFYRFHDHQTEKCRRRREREIAKTYQPSLWRRFTRATRNVLSTFKDAIVQTLNAVLGARAATSPQSPVLTRHKDLTASGAQLLESTVGSAYDPILEHYIGQYVVLEMLTHDEVQEEHGILKEYSIHYIELLNVRVEVPLYVYLRRRRHVAQAKVHVEQEGPVARVWHDLPYPLVVETLRAGDVERAIDLLIAPGEHAEIALGEAEAAAPLSLAWSVRCLADLIVPRSSALVRHAGKQEKLSWEAWLGLDDLPSLPWPKRLRRTRRDESLRLM